MYRKGISMSKADTILRQLKIDFNSCNRITEESFASEVYLIDAKTDQMILKFAHNETKYWRELKTLEFLKDFILVPNLLRPIVPEAGFNGALLMNRVPGKPLNIATLDLSLARECGKLLATMHSIPTKGLGYFQKDGFEKVPFANWWDYRRDMVFGAWTKTIEDKVDEKILKRIHSIFSRYFESFSKSSECFIHCDYRFGNIMAENGKITGLIDFESSRTGDAAYDFIKIHEVIGNHQELWQSFLSGYAELRPLPDLEKTIPYYELDLNYGFLQWAVLRGDEELFQERLAVLVKLVEKY